MSSFPQANYVMMNGRLLAAQEALVSVHDRGFRYGDGAFETIAVRGGVPCWFAWHMQRLKAGLDAIKIQFSVGTLQAQCRTLLHQNSVMDGLLRIQITRGLGGRGYLPEPHAKPTVIIETMPVSPHPPSPAKLWLSGIAKLPMRYKLCQGINSTLARMQAAEHDCFEALMLSDKGIVSESSSANIFWLKGGKLYTPSLNCGVLEGATRAALLRLKPYPAEEVEIGVETLKKAEAVFLTNVVWSALAVGSLLPEGACWESMQLAKQMRDVIDKDRKEDCIRHRQEWQSSGAAR